MVSERKRRVTVTLAMIKEIRTYLDRDKTTKEISELLNILYSTILGLCNKIMSGVPDDKLINKKGRKFQSDAQVRGVISAILLNDNVLTQRGIAEHLADSGITRSQLWRFNKTKNHKIKIQIPQSSNNSRSTPIPL